MDILFMSRNLQDQFQILFVRIFFVLKMIWCEHLQHFYSRHKNISIRLSFSFTKAINYILATLVQSFNIHKKVFS
jgi:hypothetical protein